MAIVFNCPYCQHAYRLKDDLAGKRAKCQNADCRKLITIPDPAAAPPEPPAPTKEELEAAALAALTDEPARQEVSAADKVIPMVCKFCDHKWDVPFAMAGKNVLCPECRERQRVPEPKEDVPTDWKQAKSKLPSLAKEAHEKLEGVQDAADVKQLHGDTIRKAGLIDEGIEPRPLKQKILIAATAIGLVAGIVALVIVLRSRGTTKNEEQLMADARTEFEKVKPEMNPPDAALASAVLNLADAEYSLRHNTSAKLKEAYDRLTKAKIETAGQPAGPARNLLAAEIALAVPDFGGTDAQVAEQQRFRWRPDTDSSKFVKMNERSHTVHEMLLQSLSVLAQPNIDLDFRLTLARQLTRRLAKQGQGAMAADLIPLALFAGPEQDDARAAIALELYRADKASDVPRKIADELKGKYPGNKNSAPPAFAQALFAILHTEKVPPMITLPKSASENIGDLSRTAHTAKNLLEDNPAEALNVARRPRSLEHQLKALTLCAEWSADPGPALDEAAKLIAAVKGSKGISLSPYQIVRLVEIASEKGRHEQAKALADSLSDEGAKAWAYGESLHQRALANPKEKLEETGLPAGDDDARKVKVGHVWGRLWLARQNARVSHNRDAEKKATATWPAAVHPFALAGIALGLQDQ